jgi:hypothetical protein
MPPTERGPSWASSSLSVLRWSGPAPSLSTLPSPQPRMGGVRRAAGSRTDPRLHAEDSQIRSWIVSGPLRHPDRLRWSSYLRGVDRIAAFERGLRLAGRVDLPAARGFTSAQFRGAPGRAPPMGVDFLTKWSAMRRGFSTCRDTKETRTPGRNKQRDVVCRTSRCAPPMRSELQLHRQTKQSDWLASVSDGTPAQSPPFNRDMPIGRCIAASNVYFAEVVSAPGARRAPTGSTAVRPRVAAG